jgi:energy-coupling factor transporter ATP-binding protein EcfA2
MNPLRMCATNYRTFADLDVELPAGCTAIIGPNGAGKSSVLNLVDVALFADRGELAALLTTDEERLELTLTFEHAGEVYRVRRSYSAAGVERPRSTSRSTGAVTQSLRGGRHSRARTPPRHRNSLSRRSASPGRRSVRRRSFARVTARRSRKRSRATARRSSPRSLGLEVWDRMLERARADLRVVERDLIAAATNRDRLETIVAEHVSVRTEAVTRAASATARPSSSWTRRSSSSRRRSSSRRSRRRTSVCYGSRRSGTAARQERDRLQEQLAASPPPTGSTTCASSSKRPLRTPRASRRSSRSSRSCRTQRVRSGRRRAGATSSPPRLSSASSSGSGSSTRASSCTPARTRRAGKAQHLDDHIGEASECDRCGQTLGAEAAARAAESYRDDAQARPACRGDRDAGVRRPRLDRRPA